MALVHQRPAGSLRPRVRRLRRCAHQNGPAAASSQKQVGGVDRFARSVQGHLQPVLVAHTNHTNLKLSHQRHCQWQKYCRVPVRHVLDHMHPCKPLAINCITLPSADTYAAVKLCARAHGLRIVQTAVAGRTAYGHSMHRALNANRASANVTACVLLVSMPVQNAWG